MANWTSNLIALRGEAAKLQAFKQAVVGDNGAIDFNKLKPMPWRMRALGVIRLRTLPAWYVWNCREWGTKWNACRARYVDRPDTLTYQFDTAWDAPRGIVAPLLDLAGRLDLSVRWEADHEDDGHELLADVTAAEVTA
jgi:hypothetical protein